MSYQANIGMEVHVQLSTKSKIFCSCPNQVTSQPNTNICPICAGYPGVLPVLNKEVVNSALRLGLATHCAITPITSFARKHYFYPDLPKNYQITQGTQPICSEGYITITREDGTPKKIRLIRIHIEEDAGKNIHSATTNESFVDLNRTGTPLLEIVSYPDIETAYEAREYLKMLRNIVLHLGIGTGNMEEGALRADTNISVRKTEELGTRIELKNINSFKFIYDAIEYEIKRQIETLENGGTIRQETRLWDTKNKQTVLMRSKEEAADYRYFEEPDLPVLRIDQAWLETIKQSLPELPEEKFNRLTQKVGLSAYEANILIDDLALSAYFDAAYAILPSKSLINWVLRNVLGTIKEQKVELEQFKLTPQFLAELVALIENGTISNSIAQEVFLEGAETGYAPAQIVKEKNLAQIGSVDELEAVVKQVVAQHQEQVAQYKAGNERLFGFFVGQAMKATDGKANPQLLQQLIKKHLS